MKARSFYISSISLLIIFSANLIGQDIFQSYQSKEELESDVSKIINEFDQYMKDQGVEPPFVPGIRIRTEAFLIKWDEPNKGIILPYWDELFEEQKALFQALKGEDAEEFFISMFNWFLVPHELGHFINPMDDSLSPYKREQAANEFAVAFFLSQEKYQQKLDFVEKSVPEVLSLLPEIDFEAYSEEDYFDMNYTHLGSNPNIYGYFQFKFIQNILQNKEDINILSYFANEK